jgi:hypothetical protein
VPRYVLTLKFIKSELAGGTERAADAQIFSGPSRRVSILFADRSMQYMTQTRVPLFPPRPRVSRFCVPDRE